DLDEPVDDRDQEDDAGSLRRVEQAAQPEDDAALGLAEDFYKEHRRGFHGGVEGDVVTVSSSPSRARTSTRSPANNCEPSLACARHSSPPTSTSPPGRTSA